MQLSYTLSAAYPHKGNGRIPSWSKNLTVTFTVNYNPDEKDYSDLEIEMSNDGGDITEALNDLLLLDTSFEDYAAEKIDWWQVYRDKVDSCIEAA